MAPTIAINKLDNRTDIQTPDAAAPPPGSCTENLPANAATDDASDDASEEFTRKAAQWTREGGPRRTVDWDTS